MITNGRYKARATGDVVLGESAKKGTPFIELYFQITEGDNKGGEVRWTSYFTDKTSERTIESLYHCGWEGPDLEEFKDGGLHGLDKNEVEIVVELEEYEHEGEKRTAPRVQWVNRAGGYLNVENKMAPEKLSTFSDRMKGLALKVKEKKGIVSADNGDFPHGANVDAPKATGTEGRKF